MKVKIVTLGCKVNFYESEFISEIFKKNNYIIDENNPNIIVINTCSVTNQADSKSKKIIRKEKRNHPKSIIIVCGCMAESHQDNLDDLEIDILIGNKDKSKIVDLLEKYLINQNKIKKFYDLRNIDFENMTINKYEDRTRAFVKIEDGCNNFCSYCIIPYTRGQERSKDYEVVIKEVMELVNNGHKEIVFTGIHTGNYNYNGKRLVDIIKKVSLLKHLERIRISSIEATEIDDDFLNELKINGKICNHLHIPLQSGSNKILSLMNRKYNIDLYLSKINSIKKVRPDISITTDIIVGFPNETDEDFLETINLCELVKFSKIHVFPYSKRDKTKAALMENQVSDTKKSERSKKLILLSNKLEKKYASRFIGKKLDVLVEKTDKDYSIGHSSNYLEILVAKKLQKNEIVEVKILKIEPNIIGDIK